MSHNHNVRKKAIKRFLKDRTTKPSFRMVKGKWKMILEEDTLIKHSENECPV